MRCSMVLLLFVPVGCSSSPPSDEPSKAELDELQHALAEAREILDRRGSTIQQLESRLTIAETTLTDLKEREEAAQEVASQPAPRDPPPRPDPAVIEALKRRAEELKKRERRIQLARIDSMNLRTFKGYADRLRSGEKLEWKDLNELHMHGRGVFDIFLRREYAKNAMERRQISDVRSLCDRELTEDDLVRIGMLDAMQYSALLRLSNEETPSVHSLRHVRTFAPNCFDEVLDRELVKHGEKFEESLAPLLVD